MYILLQNTTSNIIKDDIFFQYQKKRSSLKKHVHFQKQLVNITFSKARTCNYVGDSLTNMRFWKMWVQLCFQIDFLGWAMHRFQHMCSGNVGQFVFWQGNLCMSQQKSVIWKNALTIFKISYLFKVSHTQLYVLDFGKCDVPTLILKLNILFFEDVTNCFL